MILALLDFRGTKGDTNGSRGDTKAIFMPEHWLPTIEEQFTRLRAENEAREKGVMVTANNKSVRAFPGLLSEHMIRKTLSQTDPELTLHSARRGACHTLLKIFSRKQIARLALHAQNDRKKVATTALYTHGAWFQEEREQDQMRMSLALLNLAKIISRSTMLALFRAWCARDSFRYLDFFEEGGL